METTTTDPTAPLPAPPDPWAGSTMPSPRDGPPYHMTDMIAAEPHLARRLLSRLAGASAVTELGRAIRTAVEAHEPVVVTGCGTSEHAAQGVVEILRDAIRAAGIDVAPGSIVAAQAFEAALDPQRSGVLIGVSHEGGSAATNAAIEAAGRNGARTALITAGNGSPGAKLAETVVTTDEMDQSWCHTVGYVSPLIAAAAIGASLSGRGLDGSSVADLMTAGASDAGAAELIAAALAKTNRIIVIGSGADRVAARELVLKIEEAAWIPSAMRDLETFLHGHLPATDETTGLVLLLTDRDRGTERVARARQALAAAKVVGIRAAAIVSADVTAALDLALTPAGRIVIPAAASLPAPIASLLGTATALQLLTERIARATGRNPDAIRREDARYLAAAAAAD